MQTSLARYGMDSSFETLSLQERGDVLIARWVKNNALPFTITSTQEFKDIFLKLCPRYIPRSANTVRSKVPALLCSLYSRSY